MVTKTNITVIVLAVLLVAALGYIGFNFYMAKKVQQQTTMLQQGYALGYEQAVLQLMQQAATCQPVPITAENQTINLIAVECPAVQQLLQAAQQGQ